MGGAKRVINEGLFVDIPQDFAERWDAGDDDLITMSGANVTNWAGQNGTNAVRDAGMAGWPTRAVMGGTPVVRFDADAGLDVLNHSWNDSGTNATFFVAVRLPTTHTNSGVFFVFNNDKTSAQAAYCGHTTGDWLYSNMPTAFAGTGDWQGRGIVWAWRATSDTVYDRKAGRSNLTAGTRVTSTAGTSDMKFGAYGTTTLLSTCGIAEVIVYDRELNDAEISCVQHYLANKHNCSCINSPAHRSGGAGYLPPGYNHRWDAKAPDSITYLTSPATNDVDGWLDETGALDLATFSVTSTYPEYIEDTDGNPCVHFQNDGGLRAAYTRGADFVTTLAVVRYPDKGSETGSAYALTAGADCRIINSDHTGPTYPQEAILADGVRTGTHDYDNRIELHALQNKWYTTSSNYLRWFLGQGEKEYESGLVSNAIVATTYLTMGTYHDGNSIYDANVNVYEVIVYDRYLDFFELDTALNYLAAKWNCGGTDAATDEPVPTRLRTWESDGPDPKGLQCTFGTPATHKVLHTVPDIKTPRRNVNDSTPMKNYPRYIKGKNYWFRADYTGGMTFATGDAEVGGTVSSWTDAVAVRTMDATTSGDSAVTFVPNHKGHPAIQGGTSGTPRSLQSTVDPGWGTVTDEQKMFWAAVSFTDGSIDNTIANLFGDVITARVDAAFYQDLVTSRGHVVSHVDCGTGVSNMPAMVRDATEGIYLFVWRITDLGTTSTVESWINGLKMPDRVGTAATVAATGNLSVGARADSTGDSNGYLFEMGGCNGTGTDFRVSDGMVLSMMRYMSDRYNEPYMPDTTPMDIGLHDRSSATVAATDCCLWYDPSTMKEDAWSLHDNCAELHTTPANFVMAGAPSPSWPMTIRHDEVLNSPVYTTRAGRNSIYSMEALNGYNMGETTDFPGDTLGGSSFLVSYTDSLYTTSNPFRTGTGIGQTRISSGTSIIHYGGSTGVTVANSTDEWAIWGSAYAYDDDGSGTLGYPGSTDASPACYFYHNNDSPQSLNTSTTASFTALLPVTNWDFADGIGRCAEQITYKHPLTNEERLRLSEYLIYKYNYHFGFDTHVIPQHHDENTVAHWNYSGDKTDCSANHPVLTGGAYSAYTGPNPHALAVHDHNGGTSGHNYGAQYSSGVDTLGAFTWTGLVWLDTYNTGSNWRPLFRSAPAAGGSGSANNIRHQFRVNDSTGVMQYYQQHDVKVTDGYLTTMVMPLQEWTFVGVSRTADGTQVDFLVGDTFEQATGFTAPNLGGNARWEMWEEWDGDDFDGYVNTCMFRTSYTDEAGLRRLRKQAQPFATG